ncbi:type II restriction enzyme [Companilactobacillus versmoldensis]|uniref:Uncharacterized protein n=1 Tax=Companilactobacillus versmoldensis DSM 14857 = KCTC 3814 TaxID=1423815 RepID=A0A0R1SL65_9LACO|nr:hypothetical protein [Companilactobacillus versmoldensis]KRL66803.1 hypothetical protein FC27_GL000248 [Companilactobacillus versmoldensis DSM 14857 = KCTC 3814]
MTKSKTELAWEKLFQELNIDSDVEKNGVFHLTADQIKEIGGREPRLMTKFDNRRQLPKILQEKNLAILPDTRGTYLVGKFKAYQDYDHDEIQPIVKQLPDYIKSINIKEITSEPVALNMAKASGMIDDVMNFDSINSENNGESYLTLSGRMGSGYFDYDIEIGQGNNQKITVRNSQIEVDSTYENMNRIAIFEAKTLMPKNFMVRQLYYPYRTYQGLGIKKPIIPVFFTYVDETFSFNIYEFENDNVYSSIRKVKQMDFVLDEEREITLAEIKNILLSSKIKFEEVPFPQANSFSRLLDILHKLKDPMTKDEISEAYGFDIRQSDY